jgi:hypothetical protein
MFNEDVPEATPVQNTGDWMTPSGVPLDASGNPLIPELRGRAPDHNENVVIAGFPITMASTNVQEIWWHWGDGETYFPRLFVRFLSGALYSYNGCSLTTAVGMIQTMSPGRYVHNVLRIEFPTKGTGWGTYTPLVTPPKGTKPRKAQVVRLRK